MKRYDFYSVADKEVQPVFPFFALSVQQLYHLTAKKFKMYPLNIHLFKKYSCICTWSWLVFFTWVPQQRLASTPGIVTSRTLWKVLTFERCFSEIIKWRHEHMHILNRHKIGRMKNMLAHPYSCKYTWKQPFQCDLLEALSCGFPPRQDLQSEMFIEENLEKLVTLKSQRW